jgi:hypothetical protein
MADLANSGWRAQTSILGMSEGRRARRRRRQRGVADSRPAPVGSACVSQLSTSERIGKDQTCAMTPRARAIPTLRLHCSRSLTVSSGVACCTQKPLLGFFSAPAIPRLPARRAPLSPSEICRLPESALPGDSLCGERRHREWRSSRSSSSARSHPACRPRRAG